MSFSIRCGASLAPGKGATLFEGSAERAFLVVVDCPVDTISLLQVNGGGGREIYFTGSFSVVVSGEAICTGSSVVGGAVSVKVFPVEAVSQEVSGCTLNGPMALPRYSLLMALEECTLSDGVGSSVVIPALTEVETYFPELTRGRVRVRQVL